ncbi:arp2/3 complex-activating protein rickA [Latimeria chalumnae]|uniref:arp2/3 complex-activating protein rickA n=1 Tax=Latimeria chalumnae TaxID=7897 RepID=UPI00313DCA92
MELYIRKMETIFTLVLMMYVTLMWGEITPSQSIPSDTTTTEKLTSITAASKAAEVKTTQDVTQQPNISWIVASCIGGILVFMLVAIITIAVWKSSKRETPQDPNWAGRSPFADGEIPTSPAYNVDEAKQSKSSISLDILPPLGFNKFLPKSNSYRQAELLNHKDSAVCTSEIKAESEKKENLAINEPHNADLIPPPVEQHIAASDSNLPPPPLPPALSNTSTPSEQQQSLAQNEIQPLPPPPPELSDSLEKQSPPAPPEMKVMDSDQFFPPPPPPDMQVLDGDHFFPPPPRPPPTEITDITELPPPPTE